MRLFRLCFWGRRRFRHCQLEILLPGRTESNNETTKQRNAGPDYAVPRPPAEQMPGLTDSRPRMSATAHRQSNIGRTCLEKTRRLWYDRPHASSGSGRPPACAVDHPNHRHEQCIPVTPPVLSPAHMGSAVPGCHLDCPLSCRRAALLMPQTALAQAGAPAPGATPATPPLLVFAGRCGGLHGAGGSDPHGCCRPAGGASLGGSAGHTRCAGRRRHDLLRGGVCASVRRYRPHIPHPELRNLVWEWSPLPTDWGIGWGAAGLSGWFLSGEVTALNYALFLSHLPWVFTVALIPALALRGRAPALVGLLVGLVLGGLVYPLAGNWAQGGGWLSALGRNLQLGHGFVDVGGAGTSSCWLRPSAWPCWRYGFRARVAI